MSKDLEIVQGSAKDFTLQVYNPDGSEAGGFLPTDVLTAKVWSSKDDGVSFSPPVAWLPPQGHVTGRYVISFANADTASWLPQSYDFQVFLERDHRKGEITGGGANIRVLPSAETGSILPVYCSIKDIIGWCRWVENLNVFETDDTGFMLQRNKARYWLENAIQRHYRASAGSISFGGTLIPTWGPRKSGAYSAWLQAQLDAGPALPTDGPNHSVNLVPTVPGLSPGLMINGPRRVKELTAKYATFLILQDVIAGSGQRDNWYSAKADWLMNDIESLLKSYTAEINPLNGYPTITIELGLVDCMRGG